MNERKHDDGRANSAYAASRGTRVSQAKLASNNTKVESNDSSGPGVDAQAGQGMAASSRTQKPSNQPMHHADDRRKAGKKKSMARPDPVSTQPALTDGPPRQKGGTRHTAHVAKAKRASSTSAPPPGSREKYLFALVDTGANWHYITTDEFDRFAFNVRPEQDTVGTAGTDTLTYTHVGDIRAMDPKTKTPFVLSNTRRTQGLSESLISVSALTRHDFNVKVSKHGITLRDGSGRRTGVANERDGVYPILLQ
jgi:hypothetical protein